MEIFPVCHPTTGGLRSVWASSVLDNNLTKIPLSPGRVLVLTALGIVLLFVTAFAYQYLLHPCAGVDPKGNDLCQASDGQPQGPEAASAMTRILESAEPVCTSGAPRQQLHNCKASTCPIGGSFMARV